MEVAVSARVISPAELGLVPVSGRNPTLMRASRAQALAASIVGNVRVGRGALALEPWAQAPLAVRTSGRKGPRGTHRLMHMWPSRVEEKDRYMPSLVRRARIGGAEHRTVRHGGPGGAVWPGNAIEINAQSLRVGISKRRIPGQKAASGIESREQHTMVTSTRRQHQTVRAGLARHPMR